MTTLEIILIIIIWASYGIFSAFQTIESSDLSGNDEDCFVGSWLILIGSTLFAPLVFCGKCIYGAFKKYDL